MSSAHIIVGRTPTGTLYACVDATSRYTKPQTCAVRLAALLAPFPTEQEARAALEAAGASIVEGGAE